MTTTVAPLVRVHWHHPEWVALAVATGGWLGLVATVAGDPSALLVGTHHPGAGALGQAALMAAAMMAPLVITQAHHVAVSSLWPRRYRAVVGYLAGYLGVWTLVGALMMTGIHVLRPWVGVLPLVALTGASAVVVAATENHRRRLRRCGATRPLALAGWRADRDCVDAGVRMGGRCVATTWALMIAVMAQGGLLALAAGMVFMVAERRGLVPDRRLVRWTLLVAVFAVLVTLAGLGSGSTTTLPVDSHAGH
jgi:hypothetical protein